MPVNVTVGNTTFGYGEIKYGKTGSGNRGIRIWVSGQQGTAQEYKLSPNPHNNSAYNGNGQPLFYRQVAESIGHYYNTHQNTFPVAGSQTAAVTALDETYRLEAP